MSNIRAKSAAYCRARLATAVARPVCEKRSPLQKTRAIPPGPMMPQLIMIFPNDCNDDYV